MSKGVNCHIRVWYEVRESIFTNLTASIVLSWDHRAILTMLTLLDQAFKANYGNETKDYDRNRSDIQLRRTIIMELHDYMLESIGDEWKDHLEALNREEMIKHIMEYKFQDKEYKIQGKFDPSALILGWSDVYDNADTALFNYAVELQYIEDN
ncbi:MAG: hypothetical protein EOP45_19090 [Sphingobacteriaceae bacterium]|nr:MAG: hypothetical protein EOP45_19090 [Sphingobacteriaceae bacterium]